VDALDVIDFDGLRSVGRCDFGDDHPSVPTKPASSAAWQPCAAAR
jgi:hypothetical protein